MRLTRRNLLGLAPFLLLNSCGSRRSPRYRGFALVANRDSRSIAVIDLSRFEPIAHLDVPAPPEFVFSDPSSKRGFVLSKSSNLVEIVDLDRMRISGRVPLHATPVDARLSADSRVLWIALREPDGLLGLDTNAVARRTWQKLPAPPLSMDLRDRFIALALERTCQVALFDATRARLITSTSLHPAPELVRLRPDGKMILATSAAARSMTAIEAASLERMVVLSLPVAPRHLTFNADGGQLFVTGDGMDAVAIVSPYQTEVGETILAGSQPGAMAATRTSPAYLFIANGSGDVSVMNIDTRRILARISVGQQPGPIVLTPDDQYALVLNRQSGDVAVIRTLDIRNLDWTSRHNRLAPLFTMIPVGVDPCAAAICPRLV